MPSPRVETTLKCPCSVSGRGYWSGKLNTLTFHPAPVGTGIQFRRGDIASARAVPVVTANCIGMPLRTRLTDGFSDFDMIEHVMSALAGLQIDNAIVACTESEMPGFDGSSYPIALALHQAGIEPQREAKATFQPSEPIQIGDAEQFVRLEPPGADQSASLVVEYQLDYGADSPIGIHTFTSECTPETYLHSIAPARTFITEQDAKHLQDNGMATHVTERDLVVFGPSGPILNELRFEDECARHKALDLIGDLALTGLDLVGRLIARRSGHQMNGEMAKLIDAQVEVASGAPRRVA
ncbi:MAG: UDP-3-O-acyl-N-acetylglucosamine deacetylase [Planctomycetota bacterium]|nr:UDP-3-O-acyl-N-acetylglucosamine deacetylase [Planctomycetota bacterium]